jgi:hypothetical protein
MDMKNTIIYRAGKAIALFFTLFITQTIAFAQDRVEITTDNAGSWFERNWMWVAGIVFILLLIVIFSGSSSSSRSTTTVRDDYGNVSRVTTTEVEE